MDERTLNDLLECSVCLNQLNTASKVLPCQHTFCRSCLQEIVDKHRELRCPECRVLVTTRIDDLPPNVLLMRILEGIRNTSGGGGAPIQQPQAKNPPVVKLQQTTGTKLSCVQPVIIAPPPSSGHVQAVAHHSYAKALYDYQPKEPGHLHLTRGDIIYVKKRIDGSWSQGECAGRQGFFPTTFVQFITPMASSGPQCKALYDFRMANEGEEDGCLAFNKGDIISVLRRVDENWAEGKLDGRVGIFPLSFVELNALATSLMKLSTNVQPGPSKVAPPTPTLVIKTTSSGTTNAVATTVNGTELITPLKNNQSALVTNGGKQMSDTCRSDSQSRADESTTDHALSGSSSSSPSSNNVTTPPSATHSSTNSSYKSISPSSPANITKPDLLQNATDKRSTGTTSSNTMLQNVSGAADVDAEALLPPPLVSRRNKSSSPSAQTVSTSSNELPTLYMALFPYKPQKGDELELKRGALYTVIERGRDGWFKGTANRILKVGLFPGNYVVSVDQNATTASTHAPMTTGSAPPPPRSSEHKLLSLTCVSASSSPSVSPTPPVTVTTSQRQALLLRNNTTPPELPPRSLSPSASSNVTLNAVKPHQETPKTKERKDKSGTVSLMRRLTSIKRSKSPQTCNKGGNTNTSNGTGTTPSEAGSVYEEAFFTPKHQPSSNKPNASSSAGMSTPYHVRSGSCPSQWTATSAAPQAKHQNSMHVQQKRAGGGNSGGSGGSSSGGNPANNARASVRALRQQLHGSGVLSFNALSSNNGMHSAARCVTSHASKSRQPPSNSLNSRLTDSSAGSTTVCTTSTFHPLQPHGKGSGGTASPGTVMSSSHCATVTNHRKCHSLDAGNHSAPHHVSVINGSGGGGGGDRTEMIANNSSSQQQPHRIQTVRERFRCIAPYPPNSEYELELQVNDILYVHRKRDDGWYKGTQQRTGKTGLFPASFVEIF